jgi:hypothetical protein
MLFSFNNGAYGEVQYNNYFTGNSGSYVVYNNVVLNLPTNITIPLTASTFFVPATSDAYFQADVYMTNLNTTDNSIIDQSSGTTGIANEFGFGISQIDSGRGIPQGRLLIYYGTRGSSLAVYYTNLSIPLSSWTTVTAQRVSGNWTMTVGGVNASLTYVPYAVPSTNQLGNLSLPCNIGKNNSSNTTFLGQIRNVYASYKT